jgi:hypothetical protein
MAATPVGGLPGCDVAPFHGDAQASVVIVLTLLAFALVCRRPRSAS